MTEEELRGYVREAIARHRGGEAPASPAPGAVRLDPSHALLPVPRGSDDDGACVIEPAVRCNHCGYCVSYGH
jgi:ferredoxin